MRVSAALGVLVAAACGGVQRQASAPPVHEIPVESFPEPAPVRPAGGEPEHVAAVAFVDGCAEDMVRVGDFCIDRFEAPNTKGEVPFALVTAYDGEAWCSERGKRLCTEDEWVRACGGPHGRLYPYGDAHREDICNDDRPWILVHWKALAKWPGDVAVEEATHLLQADMSGARADCVSEEGVYDLTGNVAEWVRRSVPSGRPGYDHVLKGCYWAGCFKEPHPNCAFTNAAHPGIFRTYEAGFRCCSKRDASTGSR
jgi:formylglycine-generating enzyme required for sulfatase activity